MVLAIILIRIFMALMLILATLLILPQDIVCQSEVAWRIHGTVRRWLRNVMELSMRGPFFQALVYILRKLSCGLLSSRCQAPQSLRAKVLSTRELAVWWTPQYPKFNPFHEERYICSWTELNPDESKSGKWREQPVEENGFGDSESRRWGTLLDGLPRAALRVRVCAVNLHGRSQWSDPELEVPGSDRPAGTIIAGEVGHLSGPRCLQCRVTLPRQRPVAHADVTNRPVVARGCRHGPFCARCRQSVSAATLPSCVCHALISSWREQPLA